MMKKMEYGLLDDTREFVTETFFKRVSSEYLYHNIDHTLQVEEAVEVIAEASGITEHEVFLLRMAALFHDIGYCNGHEGHEQTGAEMARKYYAEKGLPEGDIAIITNCILSTNVKIEPTNLLEEMLCDADLSYLGYREYFNRGEILRLEWEKTLNRVYTDAEWYEVNLAFFQQHQFYTNYAQLHFNAQKAKNIEHLKSLLKSVQ